MKFLKVLSVIIFAAGIAALGYTVRQAQQQDMDGGPQIAFANDVISTSVNVSSEKLLEDVTATDGRDGDVTPSLVVEEMSTFMDDGRRIVTYAAFDSDKNVTKASRYLQYTDYHAPEFALNAPLSFKAGAQINLLDYVTVTDCLDGDLTADIIQTWGENTDLTEPGDYTVQLKVSNSAGDVSILTLPIHIYDAAQTISRLPKIQLSDYLIYVDQNATLSPRSLIDQVELNGITVLSSESEFPSVVIEDNVDYTKPGVYTVRYSITDEEGNTGEARLIVVVRSKGVTLDEDDTYGLVINGWDEY